MVLGQKDQLGVVAFQNTPVTKTLFSQDQEQEIIRLPLPIEYQNSDQLELGQEQVIQQGEDGWIRQTYQLTYWENELQSKSLIGEERREPVSRVVLKGTKIVPRFLTASEGVFTYYLQKRMYATSYDANCQGCRGLTYTGTEVTKGVCAVDPEVIPLGTMMYVEGYGLCRAEDVGGAIKGDRIDLGFRDILQGFWQARWTKVYLLVD